MATLSPIDAVVVMGHDVETAGRALQGALESNVGYIGSIGSPRMQELRNQWLAYRGVAWDDRVRGTCRIAHRCVQPARDRSLDRGRDTLRPRDRPRTSLSPFCPRYIWSARSNYGPVI